MLRKIALIISLTPALLFICLPQESLAHEGIEGDIFYFSKGKILTFDCPFCLADYKEEHENKLSKAEVKNGWKLLFNGKDLSGFQAPSRKSKWSVKDGVLIGSGGSGVVGTKAKFDDFEFVADIRIRNTSKQSGKTDKQDDKAGKDAKRRGNSGVFIRSKSLTALRGLWPDGFEVQIDHGDPNFWTGAIWKTAKAKKIATKDDEWFQMKIQAHGPVIRVWVAGKLVTEYKAKKPNVSGPISFQVHHPTDIVEFKNVKVRPLDGKSKKKASVKDNPKKK